MKICSDEAMSHWRVRAENRQELRTFAMNNPLSDPSAMQAARTRFSVHCQGVHPAKRTTNLAAEKATYTSLLYGSLQHGEWSGHGGCQNRELRCTTDGCASLILVRQSIISLLDTFDLQNMKATFHLQKMTWLNK